MKPVTQNLRRSVTQPAGTLGKVRTAHSYRYKVAEEERRILLWGGRTKARLLLALIPEVYPGAKVSVYEPGVTHVAGLGEAEVLSSAQDVASKWHTWTHFIVGIGGEHGYARVIASAFLERRGLVPLDLICASSSRHRTSTLGRGVQMMDRSHLGVASVLGDFSMLNTACAIDHDCRIGRGVHIMGSAVVPSYVDIGDYATVGTNATLLPHRILGEGAYVGAGAVVTKDIPPWAVAYGNPARVMRERERPSAAAVMQDMWPDYAD